jgi:hypothetical protein
MRFLEKMTKKVKFFSHLSCLYNKNALILLKSALGFNLNTLSYYHIK